MVKSILGDQGTVFPSYVLVINLYCYLGAGSSGAIFFCFSCVLLGEDRIGGSNDRVQSGEEADPGERFLFFPVFFSSYH